MKIKVLGVEVCRPKFPSQKYTWKLWFGVVIVTSAMVNTNLGFLDITKKNIFSENKSVGFFVFGFLLSSDGSSTAIFVLFVFDSPDFPGTSPFQLNPCKGSGAFLHNHHWRQTLEKPQKRFFKSHSCCGEPDDVARDLIY